MVLVWFTSEVLSCCCAVPSWLFSLVSPKAVTTTPCSSVAEVERLKLWDTAVPFNATLAELGEKPRRRAVTVTVVPVADAGAEKL
jgi:hypothetical protein